MRRISTTCLVILGVLVFCGVLRADDATPPEAAPMIQMLKAIQANDVTAFKNSYCKKIRDDNSPKEWDDHLKEAQENLKKMYGDYQLSDFAFTFSGDQQTGTLAMTFKGKGSLSLKVVKEDDGWKLNEH